MKALIEGREPPLTRLDRPDDWDHGCTPSARPIRLFAGAERLAGCRRPGRGGPAWTCVATATAGIATPPTPASRRWPGIAETAGCWRRCGSNWPTALAQCIAGVRPSAISQHPRHVSLTLDDGQQPEHPPADGADGANSWVRQQTGIPRGCLAVWPQRRVANFVARRDHGNIARQWFWAMIPGLALPGQGFPWCIHRQARGADCAGRRHAVRHRRPGWRREAGAFSLLTPGACFSAGG